VNLKCIRLTKIVLLDGEPGLEGILSPLLGIHSLEILEVTSSPDISLTLSDHNIEEMADAWPNIHTLVVCGYYDRQEIDRSVQRKLTLASISALVTRCPQLCTVGLSIDASLSEDVDLIPQDTWDGKMLERFDFCGSTVPSSAAVAVWLSRICPPEGIFWSGRGDSAKMLSEIKLIVKHLREAGLESEVLRRQVQ
jgi:hypothetical protein